MENRIKRKLGMSSSCFRDGTITEVDTLNIIKDAGFECYFTPTDDCESGKALVERGTKLGLSCEFIHASFKNINAMWMPGIDYLPVFKAMKHSIDLAADNGIPAVVSHVSSGWYPPGINDLGCERFDQIVLYAEEKGVTVAFENLRMIGNLAYFADRYEKVDTVRFCYDIGHEHCYTKTVNWMDIFCHKVVCTHIHDNMGRGWEKAAQSPDTHLLPFEGNIDYEKVVAKLDEYGYAGPLTLEINNSKYQEQYTPEEFLATCYERLQRISNFSKAPDAE